MLDSGHAGLQRRARRVRHEPRQRKPGCVRAVSPDLCSVRSCFSKWWTASVRMYQDRKASRARGRRRRRHARTSRSAALPTAQYRPVALLSCAHPPPQVRSPCVRLRAGPEGLQRGGRRRGRRGREGPEGRVAEGREGRGRAARRTRMPLTCLPACRASTASAVVAAESASRAGKRSSPQGSSGELGHRGPKGARGAPGADGTPGSCTLYPYCTVASNSRVQLSSSQRPLMHSSCAQLCDREARPEGRERRKGQNGRQGAERNARRAQGTLACCMLHSMNTGFLGAYGT